MEQARPGQKVVTPNGREFTADDIGFIRGEIEIDVNDLIGLDLDGALDFFSESLTGSGVLQQVSYRPTGFRDGMIVMEISGDPASILEDADDETPGTPAP